MKHQQVGVDYWAMGKSMLTYAFLTAMGWLMLRLFNTVIMLPRRLRSQQRSIEDTLAELQKRFPDLNITEEDLKNAEKELEEYMKEQDDKEKTGEGEENTTEERNLEKKTEVEGANSDTAPAPAIEDKKTL